MIARIKSLGVAASQPGLVTVAARRIRAYVEGKPSESLAAPDTGIGPGAANYYSGNETTVIGSGYGSLREDLGVGDTVDGKALTRLLEGNHPINNEPIQPLTAARPSPSEQTEDEWLDTSVAARIVGVNPRYLRKLAMQQPALRFRKPTIVTDERVARAAIRFMTGNAVAGKPKAYLLAHRSESGSWLVHRDELARFSASRTPANRVMAFDLTLSAPKSVSLLWAFGDEAVRSPISAAFDAAITAAVEYLERNATVGIVEGRNRTGEGLIVAAYRHDVSRENETHLHSHCIIANFTRIDGRDGTDPVWRALDGDLLLRHHVTAGYVAAAVFRRELTDRLGVEWAPVHNGVAELAPFPKPLLAHFSTRHRDIEREYEAMIANGYAPGAKTDEAAQESTRKAKRVLADGEVLEIQTERLAAFGWQPQQIQQLAAGTAHTQPLTSDDRNALFDRLVGEFGLTERSVWFTRQDAIRAVATEIGARLPTDQIEELADRLLTDERVINIAAPVASRRHQRVEARYTTLGMLEVEDSLLTLVRQGTTDVGGTTLLPVEPDRRDAVLDTWTGRLGTEQLDAVAQLVDAGDLIRCLVGGAGTGKTEAMRAAVEVWQTNSYHVVGTANGGRQAEQLHERLNIDSEVVASWLTRLDNVDDPAIVWKPDTILIIDEATQVSTRDAEQLIRYATRTSTVIIGLGDPGQLSSVGAGGWFRHVVTNSSPAVLREMRRQQGDSMNDVRAALVALRSQLPERVNDALMLLQREGRIRVCDDRAQLLINVVEHWYQDRRTPLHAGSAAPRMMAAFQRDVELLNRAARVRLAADGTLSGKPLRIENREFRIGDEVVTLTQRGHTLVPHGTGPKAYIRTGTIGTVTDTHIDSEHPERQWLEVDFGERGTATVNWAYLHHDFGDGRQGGLAHAYALTADRSQGATMPTARAVTTDATSRQALYVMLSRGQRDVAAYVIRRRDIEIDPTDENWLPILNDPTTAMERVERRLKASRAERMGRDLDPDAYAAAHLATQHTLPELAQMRTAETPGSEVSDEYRFMLRAERLLERRIARKAILDPPSELVAQIGTRPPRGAQRAAWDRVVSGGAIAGARNLDGRELQMNAETIDASEAAMPIQKVLAVDDDVAKQQGSEGWNLGL